jgi:hypothetical protein
MVLAILTVIAVLAVLLVLATPAIILIIIIIPPMPSFPITDVNAKRTAKEFLNDWSTSVELEIPMPSPILTFIISLLIYGASLEKRELQLNVRRKYSYRCSLPTIREFRKFSQI